MINFERLIMALSSIKKVADAMLHKVACFLSPLLIVLLILSARGKFAEESFLSSHKKS